MPHSNWQKHDQRYRWGQLFLAFCLGKPLRNTAFVEARSNIHWRKRAKSSSATPMIQVEPFKKSFWTTSKRFRHWKVTRAARESLQAHYHPIPLQDLFQLWNVYPAWISLLRCRHLKETLAKWALGLQVQVLWLISDVTKLASLNEILRSFYAPDTNAHTQAWSHVNFLVFSI